MLLTKTVKIKWNKGQKKNYISKGYTYTKMGDEFEIKIEDLPLNNKSIVTIKCDYCGKVYETTYCNYTKSRMESTVQKDACKNCVSKKIKEGNLLKYGVESPFQIEEVKNKIAKSNLDKYGCENPFGNKEVQNKIRQTNLQKYGFEIASKSDCVKDKTKDTVLSRYGVCSYTQSDDFKEKTKSTILEKYGCEYYVQTDEYKQKTKETSLEKYGTEHPTMSKIVQDKKKITNLKKYGVEHVLQNEEILNKQLNSLKEVFKDKTSTQQRQICEIVKDKFGNCELNHTFHGYLLDCYTVINGCKIDIEYDGWYWHKDNQARDKKRDDKCFSENIKVLRIKGGSDLPDIQELIDAINELISDNDLYYKEIILPDWGE